MSRQLKRLIAKWALLIALVVVSANPIWLSRFLLGCALMYVALKWWDAYKAAASKPQLPPLDSQPPLSCLPESLRRCTSPESILDDAYSAVGVIPAKSTEDSDYAEGLMQIQHQILQMKNGEDDIEGIYTNYKYPEVLLRLSAWARQRGWWTVVKNYTLTCSPSRASSSSPLTSEPPIEPAVLLTMPGMCGDYE